MSGTSSITLSGMTRSRFWRSGIRSEGCLSWGELHVGQSEVYLYLIGREHRYGWAKPGQASRMTLGRACILSTSKSSAFTSSAFACSDAHCSIHATVFIASSSK